MESSHILAIMAVLLSLTAISVATDHPVGDGRGWTIDFNYTTWADSRQFFVGDTLVFNYLRGDHNVYKVDEGGFKNCSVPAGVEPFDSGNDVVTLTAPGKKWYICGIPRHCSDTGQKLAITVREAAAVPPAPVPMDTGTASGMEVAKIVVVAVVTVVISGIVLV